MKILYFSPHPHLFLQDQTGYGTHMREMIAAFERMGHDVHFFVAGEQSILANRPQTAGSPSSRIKKIIKAILPQLVWETARDFRLLLLDKKNEQRLNQIVMDFQPDVLYERSHYGMIAGVRVALKHDVHHVLEVNSPNVAERIKLSGPSLLSKRASSHDTWAFSNSSHVLTVSRHLALELSIPNIAKKWSVTHNAIRPGQEKQSSLNLDRSDFDIQNSAFLVGFVGSIFPWHGVDLLIEAIHSLNKENADIQALVVGDGEILRELKEMAIRLGISEKVHFVGAVDHHDTFAYTQLCDALVLPKSHSYGSPVKIFEYALVNKPCIVPSTPPIEEVFVKKKHGWIIRPTVQELAGAIIEIKSAPENAAALSSNWHQEVVRSHTWEQNASIALEMNP